MSLLCEFFWMTLSGLVVTDISLCQWGSFVSRMNWIKFLSKYVPFRWIISKFVSIALSSLYYWCAECMMLWNCSSYREKKIMKFKKWDCRYLDCIGDCVCIWYLCKTFVHLNTHIHLCHEFYFHQSCSGCIFSVYYWVSEWQ